MAWFKKLTIRERFAIVLAVGSILFCWWSYDPVNLWNYRRVRHGMTLSNVTKIFGIESKKRVVRTFELPRHDDFDLQDEWGEYDEYLRAFFPMLPGITFDMDEFLASLPLHHQGYQYREWKSRNTTVVVLFNAEGQAVGGAFWRADYGWDRIRPWVRSASKSLFAL